MNTLAHVVKQVRNGNLDDALIYRKNLRKDADDYTATTPPHVVAAALVQIENFLRDDFLKLRANQVASTAFQIAGEVRQRLTCSGAIEHPAHGHTIDISRRDTEANDAAREDVHHDHDPVALQQDRFAAEQVYAPQAILGNGANGTTIASARKTAPHRRIPSYYEFASHSRELGP